MRWSAAVVVVLLGSTGHAEPRPGLGRSTLDGLLGLGVAGDWLAGSDARWYGNVVASAAAWRGPIGLVLDGGVSPSGAERGEGWIGGGLRVSPLRRTFDVDRPGYVRGWVEVGAAREHWGKRDGARPSVSRTLYRVALGYDLAYRHGLGTQAFLRVQHGDPIRTSVDATSAPTTEIAGTTFVIGLAVLRDL